jgi:cell division protein FtsZ
MDNYLNLVAPKLQSSYIKVIGIGCCGTNIATYLHAIDASQVDFVVCDTDATHLELSPIENKIQLGGSGLGAGTNPEVARKAAEEQKDEIKKAIGNNVRMLFITAGFGKGTGTGAAPAIAAIARELEKEIGEELLIVSIVTSPPNFEGPEAKTRAEEGIKKLQTIADATVVIDNNKLSNYEELSEDDALALVNDILVTAVKCIYNMMIAKSVIRSDFNDVKKVLQRSGVALMGIGVANGENRAEQAILIATSSELLNDRNYTDAKSVLVSISSSPDAPHKMSEINFIMDYIRNTMTNPNVAIISSRDTKDTSLGDNIKVAIVVAGFSSSSTGNTIEKETEEGGDIKDPVIDIDPHHPDQPKQPEQPKQPSNDIETGTHLKDRDIFIGENNDNKGSNNTNTIEFELKEPVVTITTGEDKQNTNNQEDNQDDFYNYYRNPNISEEAKMEHLQLVEQRIKKVQQLMNSGAYPTMTPSDLNQALNIPNYAEEDTTNPISKTQTLSGVNSKGEKDINAIACLHDNVD